MYLFNINISVSQLKFIILGIILIIIIGFVTWLVSSYYAFKWLKMNIDKDSFYFNEYNNDCCDTLEKYGDCPIKRMYLVRQPISRFAKILLNIVTLYKFEREMKKYIETKDNVFFPYHTSIMIEIELPDKNRKNILIEKNNCIKFASDFRICDKQDMRKISLSKKNTLKKILEETRERIGNNIFFNWQISRNNCQMLVKEILITINKFTEKNKEFMFQHEFAKHVKFSDFSLHIINTISNICNTIESIVGKTLYF
jgi:hypothetical protein